ncbi:hypothetical protein SAMD00023353_2000390 [Rosellinia necatrix]|uniref:Uncharacterized protein n=1 Tax=Rosellinia necatrix TaxID=77044 RepID=A0A1W2TF64_ROSNE|nr:hypothetical protein SAMD00023353_2000390 [Rosellinia necatrix]
MSDLQLEFDEIVKRVVGDDEEITAASPSLCPWSLATPGDDDDEDSYEAFSNYDDNDSDDGFGFYGDEDQQQDSEDEEEWQQQYAFAPWPRRVPAPTSTPTSESGSGSGTMSSPRSYESLASLNPYVVDVEYLEHRLSVLDVAWQPEPEPETEPELGLGPTPTPTPTSGSSTVSSPRSYELLASPNPHVIDRKYLEHRLSVLYAKQQPELEVERGPKPAPAHDAIDAYDLTRRLSPGFASAISPWW